MTPSALGLSPLANRLIDAASPEPLRLLAARGVAPALSQGDILFVAFFLTNDPVPSVRDAARATLADPPRNALYAAIDGASTTSALSLIADNARLDRAATAKVFRHPASTDALRAQVVVRATNEIIDEVSSMDAVLAVSPLTLNALYTHASTSAATRARYEELASRGGFALTSPPLPASEAAAERIASDGAVLSSETVIDDAIADDEGPSPDLDLAIEQIHLLLAASVAADDDVAEAHRVLPLSKLLEGLSVSQKIRRATIGSAEERAILVRDTNRLVAEAAITSPRLQENEVQRIAANRSVSSDVLRRIGESREWMKSYPVKVVLAQNPRLPLALALRILPMLREADLKRIALSRSVAGAVAAAAKREMQKKQG